MKNRIQILGLVLLLSACPANVKSQESTMVVKLKSGVSNSLNIKSIKSIHLASGMLYLNEFDGTNAVYANADIQKIYFEVATSVPSVPENPNVLAYPNPTLGLVYFKGLTEETIPVHVFNLSGVEVFSGRINSSVQSLDISFLPRGIYLINLNNKLVKMIKL
jgi:hypothetical protein